MIRYPGCSIIFIHTHTSSYTDLAEFLLKLNNAELNTRAPKQGLIEKSLEEHL